VREDLHTLAGAYALDALPDDDRDLFEGHLARCDACAQEVRGLREASAQLAVAVATSPPPPQLRERVMSQIGRVRQLPPLVPDLAVERRRRRSGPRSRLASVLAAACLIVALIAGGLAIRSQQELNRTRAAGDAVAAVLAAPDARTVTGPVAGGTATVVVSRSRGQVVFASAGLRQLEKSETYELWLMGPQAVRPAGLLRPDANGRTRPIVASPIADADRVGLTVEPAAGSPQPTTDPVLVLNLPRA
jgi:anti-sigma-K factor RskA